MACYVNSGWNEIGDGELTQCARFTSSRVQRACAEIIVLDKTLNPFVEMGLNIENYENGAIRQMCNVFGAMKPGECSENLGMLICICDSNGCNDTSMIKRALESGDFELTNS